MKGLGIDSAIIWSTINRGFGFVKGPINILIIIKFLSIDQQGIWYTFTNLSALTILADLGFASIITQFISHEFANLKLKDERLLGSITHLDRFYALIKFALNTYSIVVILALIILFFAGGYVFGFTDKNLLFSWILYSFSGSLGLIVSLFQSIYQGIDKVAIVQKNAFIYTLLSTLFIWGFIFLGFEIWALALGSFIAIPIVLILLFYDNIKFWKNVFTYKVIYKYSFLQDIGYLQIKYAVSFASSYLISYLYVPSIYKYFGNSYAAKFGMTLSILSVITIISGNWVMTKTPKMNILVAKKEYQSLDLLFKNSFLYSISVFVMLNLIFVSIIYLLSLYNISYSERFLNLEFTILLILTNLIGLIVTLFSTYLRCFKKEPFLFIYLINGLFVFGTLYYLLENLKDLKLFLYLVLLFNILVLLPFSLFTFNHFKKNYKLIF